MANNLLTSVNAAMNNSSDAFGDALKKLIPGKENTTIWQDIDLTNKAQQVFSVKTITEAYSQIHAVQELNLDTVGANGIDQEFTSHVVLKALTSSSTYIELVN